jgi:hypothetical protein
MFLSVGVRLFLALEVVPADLADAFDYRRLAMSLVEDGEYAQAVTDTNSPLYGIVFRAFRPPGYPLTRAAALLFTGSDNVAVLANVTFEAIALWVAFDLVRSVAGWRAGVLALAALGLYPIWVPSLTSESLTLLLWTLAARIAFSTQSAAQRGALLGLVVGFAILTRPTSVVLLGLLLFSKAPDRRRYGIVTFMTAVAVVGSWVVRNWWVVGGAVVSTNGGLHAALGYGVAGYSDWTDLHGSGHSEAAISVELARRCVEFAAEDPWAVVSVVVERLRSFLVPNSELCFELGAMQIIGYRDSPAAWEIVGGLVSLLPVTYTAGWVALCTRAARGDSLGGSFLFVSAAFAVLHCVLSRVDARLVAPVAPFLFMALGAELAWLLQRMEDLGRRIGRRSRLPRR